MSIPNLTRHYYSTPFPEHNTGDIWKDLPTNGLIKLNYCSGIVITPACDLSNNKVETLTYLPIVPVDYWFCSRNFYQIARVELIQLFKQTGLDLDGYLLPKNFIPKAEHLTSLPLSLSEYEKQLKSDINLVKKIKSGIKVLEAIISTEKVNVSSSEVKSFLGEKKYISLKEKIICNSQSNDLHFLPLDGQNIEWSAIDKHSIVLFRYPITAPIEIFDLASDINCIDWNQGINELQNRVPFAKFFTKRPLKSLKLNQIFMSDLLTRYISLYVRLGSPDFTIDTIQKYIDEI